MSTKKLNKNSTNFEGKGVNELVIEGEGKDSVITQSSKDISSTRETVVKPCSKIIQVREEEGEFYSEGFVCTTHPDRANEDGFESTMISREVCDQVCEFINSGVATTGGAGSTRACSYRHDWVKQGDASIMPAGMAVPPAEVRETGDGHYGVWCKTHHNKNHERHDQIVYDVQHGYLPGYSIEFREGNTEAVNVNGKAVKLIRSIKNFVGYAFAAARTIANPMALIADCGYREIEDIINKEDDSKMAEEEIKQEVVEQPVEEVKTEVKEEVKTETVEEPAAEVEEEKVEEKEEPKVEEPIQQKEVKIDTTEIVNQIRETKEYKKAIDSLQIKNRSIKGGSEMENITIREMKEAIKSNDLMSLREVSLREANKEGRDFFVKAINNPANYTAGFESNITYNIREKGIKITDVSVRGTLGTGDNTSSYTQADVEFADVFAPGIIDTFNNQTNLFGFLKKEAHVGGEHYQWKMVTNKDPAGNSTFVGANDVAIAKNFSSKLNYQTPLKIARRGVSVTDFINRYSARSLGDLFMLEVELQMTEMMNDVNAALFAEVADGTGLAPLGLEAVADSAGNTTLYGLTRSTGNRLAPDAAGDTYTAVGGALTEALLRAKIKNLKVEGTNKGNIAIITSPNSKDLLLNLLDGQRRFNTTEASFGFNQMNVASYDGFPIIEDADCNSDAIYIIDTNEDVIVIGMEPQLTNLAKVGAATEAYVQMDFAHVYKQPRRIGMLDTLA